MSRSLLPHGTSDQTLEQAVDELAGPDASIILHSAVTRCQSSRYTLRSRREELCGNVMDAWQKFRFAIDQAELAMSRYPSSSTYTLEQELQRASTLSRTVAATIARCIPVRSRARTSERAERFLDDLSQHYRVGDLIDDMHCSTEALQLAMSSATSPSHHVDRRRRQRKEILDYISEDDEADQEYCGYAIDRGHYSGPHSASSYGNIGASDDSYYEPSRQVIVVGPPNYRYVSSSAPRSYGRTSIVRR